MLSPHFADTEMQCRCGAADCPRLPPIAAMQPLLDALEALRVVTGPIIISDSYRCPQHNAAIGGVPGSQHTLGNAADIVVPDWSVQKMFDAAESIPAFDSGGIGAYSGKDGSTPRLHVDTRSTRARWGVDEGETQIPVGAVVNDDPERMRLV